MVKTEPELLGVNKIPANQRLDKTRLMMKADRQLLVHPPSEPGHVSKWAAKEAAKSTCSVSQGRWPDSEADAVAVLKTQPRVNRIASRTDKTRRDGHAY